MIIENFKLDSVKLLNEDIVIKYHTATDNAVQTYELKTRPPHPDFINSVNVFNTYFKDMFGLELADFTTTVKGITVKDDKLQLTGMLAAVNGSMCSLNTPFFIMDDPDLAFDKNKLDALIENARIESWKFIYEKKTSQTSLEDDLFPPEGIIDSLKQVGAVIDVGKFEVPIETVDDLIADEMSHTELKTFIKQTLINKPTSKSYWGNYTTKSKDDLKYLVNNYKDENFRKTV